MKRYSCEVAVLHSAAYHARTLWLFTVSEHKSTLYPLVTFGIIGALSGSAMTTNQTPNLTVVAARVPYAIIWMWSVLLVFSMSNQRSEEAILEDSINKPWRPIASQRLTGNQAQRLLLWLVAAVYMFSSYLGTAREALIGMVLTWMYNDLKGADDYVARNVLGALGMTLWSIGATKVACGGDGHILNTQGHTWVYIVCLIITTTLQLQDFRDQAGDRERGRSTAQLVWGDSAVRWVTAITIGFWSLAAPMWWYVDIRYYTAPILIGSLMVGRLFMYRTPEEDGKTWRIWGLWMASFFVLPLSQRASMLSV